MTNKSLQKGLLIGAAVIAFLFFLRTYHRSIEDFVIVQFNAQRTAALLEDEKERRNAAEKRAKEVLAEIKVIQSEIDEREEFTEELIKQLEELEDDNVSEQTKAFVGAYNLRLDRLRGAGTDNPD